MTFAKILSVGTDLLLTHLLIYKVNVNDLQVDNIDAVEVTNQREHIECLRMLSREKYKDVMKEWMKDLEELQSLGESKEKILEKMEAMKSKLLDKMERIKNIR